jgi:hypothetical protein
MPPKWSLSLSTPSKISRAFLISTINAICPTNLCCYFLSPLSTSFSNTNNNHSLWMKDKSFTFISNKRWNCSLLYFKPYNSKYKIGRGKDYELNGIIMWNFSLFSKNLPKTIKKGYLLFNDCHFLHEERFVCSDDIPKASKQNEYIHTPLTINNVTKELKFEGFWWWGIIMHKTIFLDFVHHLNYTTVKLEHSASVFR